MLPIQKYRWFYRIIRANTTQIPENTAATWKRAFSFIYCASAFGLFVFGQQVRKGSEDEKKKKYGEVDEVLNRLHKAGAENATIIRVSGLDFANATREEYSRKKILEEEAAGKNMRLAGDPASNCGVPGCDQPISSYNH